MSTPADSGPVLDPTIAGGYDGGDYYYEDAFNHYDGYEYSNRSSRSNRSCC